MIQSRTNGNRKKSTSPRRLNSEAVIDVLSPDFPSSNYRSSNGSNGPSRQRSLSISSAPISLPRSHIRRTPSELELEERMHRAEHEDVRMYSRLVCGMHDQIQHRYFASGGYVHPLSEKSIQGIVKTKLASDQELANHEDSHVDACDCEPLIFNEEHENCSMSSWSSQLSTSQGSMVSLLTLEHDSEKIDQEDQFVFDMDM